jgi:hypothetical protein
MFESLETRKSTLRRRGVLAFGGAIGVTLTIIRRQAAERGLFMSAVFARIPRLFCSLVKGVFSAAGTSRMALASIGCQTGNCGGFGAAVFAIEGRHRVLGEWVRIYKRSRVLRDLER